MKYAATIIRLLFLALFAFLTERRKLRVCEAENGLDAEPQIHSCLWK
ncbi:MAG: hypothetical protein ACOX0U_00035 [Oscillospiraceae bacterium]